MIKYSFNNEHHKLFAHDDHLYIRSFLTLFCLFAKATETRESEIEIVQPKIKATKKPKCGTHHSETQWKNLILVWTAPLCRWYLLNSMKIPEMIFHHNLFNSTPNCKRNSFIYDNTSNYGALTFHSGLVFSPHKMIRPT